ncbi:adenylyl-sulfate kinase [Acinetobacter sp. MB5]|uniref:adenylyl-sulfate kinase n=1 Tax=Acinetobacter sp. MB5 TaxID=2069438 RepID=UPI000DD07573|nr:adenylyl-sulfate kinase [Acinetobacter sp. MB5]
MIVMLCGLSGAGKTTIANALLVHLKQQGYPADIIDGDESRKYLFPELGYTLPDRCKNMERMAWLAHKLSNNGIIAIISAMNPDQNTRNTIKKKYLNVKEVFVYCSVESLFSRDTKGLYKKSQLPDGHKDKISNLSGINGDFHIPQSPDLVINTDTLSVEDAVKKITQEIILNA